MDPKDIELKKNLAHGPLIQDGFNELLRKRIERSMDEPRQKAKRLFWFRPAGAASAVCMLLLVFGIFHSESLFNWIRSTESASLSSDQAREGNNDVSVQSAFLIGLRTDHPTAGGTSSSSSYRTVLIAPEEGKLAVSAQGDGLLMPYKQDFWFIRPTEVKLGDEVAQRLEAYKAKDRVAVLQAGPAKQKSNAATAKDWVEHGVIQEKLVFVGNRYVALSRQTAPIEQGETKEELLVKELEQLTAANSGGVEPYVPLSTVLTNNEKQQIRPWGERWTIVRENGHWLAKQALYRDGEKGVALSEQSYELPEVVVNHDELMEGGWETVKQLDEHAQDAFYSPQADMLAIVEDERIVIYPYRDGIIQQGKLTIPLGEEETIVMSQWAVEPYVELWRQQVKQFLNQ